MAWRPPPPPPRCTNYTYIVDAGLAKFSQKSTHWKADSAQLLSWYNRQRLSWQHDKNFPHAQNGMLTWTTVNSVLHINTTLTPTTSSHGAYLAHQLLQFDRPRTNLNVFSHFQIPVFPEKKDTISFSVCMHSLTLNFHCFVRHMESLW